MSGREEDGREMSVGLGQSGENLWEEFILLCMRSQAEGTRSVLVRDTFKDCRGKLGGVIWHFINTYFELVMFHFPILLKNINLVWKYNNPRKT